MNTRTRTFDYHVTRMGFGTVLQGHYISEKTYALVQAVEGGFSKAYSLVKTWAERSRSRRQLASLNAHMLKDIGVEPYEVQREMRKPFWKA